MSDLNTKCERFWVVRFSLPLLLSNHVRPRSQAPSLCGQLTRRYSRTTISPASVYKACALVSAEWSRFWFLD